MFAFNRKELASIRDADDCQFVDLLGYNQVVRPKSGEIDFEAIREQAERQLAAFPGSVDGIVAFWDFPSSALAGVLRNAHGLPGPSNEAIAKCEHKYWSRLEQYTVVPDLVPEFRVFDPFATAPLQQIDLEFPYWIKPIKAHSSHLGFKIRRAADLHAHLPEIRSKASHFGAPFSQYLRHVELPMQIAHIDGYWFIAESIISAGRQCTLEGYVYRGEVHVYGVVDSIRSGKHRSCFSRYQYPSRLPRQAQERMILAARKVMTRFGYDGAPFNMEFYWDHRTDRIRLLEVNARISKSHCPLFRLVDGASHQEIMVDLALDRRPNFPKRRGEFAVAGKFMVRLFNDGIIKAMPSETEIDRLQRHYPELRIRLMAQEGDRLRHMAYQDSYSFEIAEIFLGARNQSELLEKYDHCLDSLSFDIRPEQQGAA